LQPAAARAEGAIFNLKHPQGSAKVYEGGAGIELTSLWNLNTADVGIIGMANAGKSTCVKDFKPRPKIAIILYTLVPCFALSKWTRKKICRG
jgi:GTPase involved in cell partitioning and DNA repair